MAYTQADLDALQQAIATGANRVRFGDKDTSFRTLDEMLRLEDKIKAAIAGKPRVVARRSKFNRGL